MCRSDAMIKRLLFAIPVALAVALGATFYLGTAEDRADADGPAPAVTPERLARGAYLARAGNCMTCHTTRGGEPYAGGRAIQTPFGAIYSTNLTPDANTGLGSWTANDFWRAMHNGKSRDGRLLYPAFPYPNYTRVTRDDADAMYVFFKSVKPVAQANR